MSWSGPVAGAASYKSPPLTDNRPPYHPLSQQHGQLSTHGQYSMGHASVAYNLPHQAPDHRPPKKKGNPIITRYPPPPGYRGPVQPQRPFGTTSWSRPQHGYPQANIAPSVYASRAYHASNVNQGSSPQGYSTSPLPGDLQQSSVQPQNYHWPQQTYASSQSFPQGQSHSAPANNFAGYSHHSALVYPIQHAYSESSAWSTTSVQPHELPINPCNPYAVQPQNVTPFSDTNMTSTPVLPYFPTPKFAQDRSQPASTASVGQSNEKPELFLAWDDWDFDFEGAIWPKSNEPVDPNLSLGVIIWHPAKQVTRALPATFREAEEQALEPTPEKLDNGESVSMFFTNENSHEAFLDVRQTDDWETIRNDPVFVIFDDDKACQNLVPLEDCISQRDRPDELTEENMLDGNEEMFDVTWSVMDHLEKALSGTNLPPPFEINQHETLKSTQEDILATLGVTGEPKPPSSEPVLVPFTTIYNTPPEARSEIPVYDPSTSKSQLFSRRARSHSGSRHDSCTTVFPRPYGSLSAGSSIAPPSQPTHHQESNPSGPPVHTTCEPETNTQSPGPSEGSNCTMISSDFTPKKSNSSTQKDNTIGPSLQRSDSSFSRKRSYGNASYDDEISYEHMDPAKRKRRWQVDAAYSRR